MWDIVVLYPYMCGRAVRVRRAFVCDVLAPVPGAFAVCCPPYALARARVGLEPRPAKAPGAGRGRGPGGSPAGNGRRAWR